MSAYTAPLAEMEFTLHQIAGMDTLASLPKFAHAEADLISQILEEAGKFASNVLNPLDQSGDTVGAQIENGVFEHPQGSPMRISSSPKPAGSACNLMKHMAANPYQASCRWRRQKCGMRRIWPFRFAHF